jgi:hypothetical protein
MMAGAIDRSDPRLRFYRAAPLEHQFDAQLQYPPLGRWLTGNLVAKVHWDLHLRSYRAALLEQQFDAQPQYPLLDRWRECFDRGEPEIDGQA